MAWQGMAGQGFEDSTARHMVQHGTQHSTAPHSTSIRAAAAQQAGQDRTGLPACEEANDRESSGAEGKEEGRLCGMACAPYHADFLPPRTCLTVLLPRPASPRPALPCLQVLDEIGVDLGSQLSAAPKQRLAAAQKQQQQQEQQPEPEEDLLASRLAALK